MFSGYSSSNPRHHAGVNWGDGCFGIVGRLGNFLLMSTTTLMYTTVDGCEILHQLIGGLYPWFLGFQPPKMVLDCNGWHPPWPPVTQQFVSWHQLVLLRSPPYPSFIQHSFIIHSSFIHHLSIIHLTCFLLFKIHQLCKSLCIPSAVTSGAVDSGEEHCLQPCYVSRFLSVVKKPGCSEDFLIFPLVSHPFGEFAIGIPMGHYMGIYIYV